MVVSSFQSVGAGVSHGASRDPSQQDDPPSTEPSIGVPQERVDSRILLIIERLFPSHHGLDFLARLLRCAREKQLVLPGIEQPEVSNVAVISAQSLRILAKQLGLSYDTTEKYIVVFCQLHLLQKLRQRRQITLHFPLSCPQLPEPDALDHLLECRPGKDIPRYRPKVRSFAQGVKRRFVLLCERKEIAVTRREKKGDSPLHLPGNLPQLLLSDMRQVIEQEVDSETGKRLLLLVEGVIRSRCKLGTSLLSASFGDSERMDGKDIDQVYTKKSPSHKSKGDSLSKGLAQQSLPSAQKGDSLLPEPRPPHSQKSPFWRTEGDSFSQPASQNGRPSAQNGNFLLQKGDSEQERIKEWLTNVNVSSIIESLNVNVKPVLSYLRALFDRDEPRKLGYYYNLYEKQQCQNTEAWLAATLETILAMEHARSAGKKFEAGRYFYKRCLALHREGISKESGDLVQRLRSLSYQQVVDGLNRSQVRPGASVGQKSPLLAREARGNSVPPPQKRPGMNPGAYKMVRTLLKAGEHTKNMQIACYRQADGTYLVRIEDFLGRKRWVSSLEEWQSCQEQIRRSIWPAETGKQ